jgi:predicted nucleic acid-binding protein
MTIAEPPRVYVDANILIFSIEKNPEWEPLVRPLMAAMDATTLTVVSSELTYAEVMVKPLAEGWQVAIDRYEDVFGPGSPLTIIPVGRQILHAAATLRGQHHLKLADAIHLASAISARCRVLVTHDGPLGQAAAMHMRSRSLRELPLLSDILAI